MNIKINYKNKEIREFPMDVSLYEIGKEFQKDYEFPIIAARVDNVMEDLSQQLSKKATVDFYDRSSVTGNAVYSRAVHFLMIVALKKILGENIEVVATVDGEEKKD